MRPPSPTERTRAYRARPLCAKTRQECAEAKEREQRAARPRGVLYKGAPASREAPVRPQPRCGLAAVSLLVHRDREAGNALPTRLATFVLSCAHIHPTSPSHGSFGPSSVLSAPLWSGVPPPAVTAQSGSQRGLEPTAQHNRAPRSPPGTRTRSTPPEAISHVHTRTAAARVCSSMRFHWIRCGGWLPQDRTVSSK